MYLKLVMESQQKKLFRLKVSVHVCGKLTRTKCLNVQALIGSGIHHIRSKSNQTIVTSLPKAL